MEHGVSLDEITRSVHVKFNCIAANFDGTLTSKGGLIGNKLACSPRDPSSNPAQGQ